MFADLRGEWRRDRNVVFYLIVSAVFRDGLAGIFAFGAVLGVSVYGISQADVLIFGVVASTVAAAGAVVGGRLDDRIGAKPILIFSLTSLIIVGAALMATSGPVAFWVCGLLLCLFVGPTQSAARTLLLRMTGEGKEGVVFGLYTMTGRAAAPWRRGCSSSSSTCSTPIARDWPESWWCWPRVCSGCSPSGYPTGVGPRPPPAPSPAPSRSSVRGRCAGAPAHRPPRRCR